MSLNTVILSGRAGRDPEVRYFESGQNVAKFTMAVDRNAKGEDADWFDVEVWGKSAQFAADYLRKGARVAVEGRLKQERWQDKSGQNRSSVVVSAFRLELLDTKADAQARQQRQAQQGGQGQGSSPQQVWAGGGNDFTTGEIPF
jgi:single-strand DNA-binding protein